MEVTFIVQNPVLS